LGFDWPISYHDLAPYYDKVDQLVGVFGSKEGLENNPDSNYFLPPPKPRLIDHFLTRSASSMDLRAIPKRAAILTQPLNNRSSCLYATDCHRGCSVGAAFQSPIALVNPALETGNLDLLTDAMARKILHDQSGRANGVLFIDKKTGLEHRARAKAVIVAGSSLESARILFNSRSSLFPQGVGTSSGHLGKWIMDTPTAQHETAQFPFLEGLDPFNEDGVSVGHTYIPWTQWSGLLNGKFGFPRGYYMTWTGGRTMPSFKNIPRTLKYTGDAYGSALKKEARRHYRSF
jgi:choline dehydrogenase-like flavoprotein